ncbi:MAG: hypothetical protein COT24_01825 [Candidatus Kerfeldbacteria bacterium CG08_land_8_20_14_0_20_40_16]|uniref:Uncharacterized protein n=1 Tax=Candidatus Kerfeldbacteria bacterium CG08_land_8_20_14_0_20_40_16 TaxID=2014244 RepID=A0A2H0YW79_9BACT|nr:MAG: hypothetical protein COT24_01825 [Candidatus Kerfeldbacteria bacterium CG08_land_8_20_14_0_20_40_16]
MIFATVAASTGTWIANFDWSKPTWDMFIILFFVVAALLYGMSLGRDRIIVILVSIYMALAVVNTAPYINDVNAEVGVNQFFVVRITAFVAIFVFLFFLLSRSALLATVASSDDKGKWWQVIIFSILHVGLLISIILSFLSESAAENLAPATQTIFVSEIGRFIWIVAPILLMILLKGGAANKKKYKYDI